MIAPDVILVVEDEPKLASLLADYLRASGFDPVTVDRGDTVLAAITEHRPALLLLDINLPGMDGLTLCKEIRRTSDLPIIMVTARAEEIDRLLGLELGADDYICKPFSPREVVARVRAVLRRTRAETTAAARVPMPIEFEARRAVVAARPGSRTSVEF